MQDIIEKILELSQKNQQLSQHQHYAFFSDFIQLFYQDNNNADFENYTTQQLFDFASSAFNFLTTKKNQDFAIRVYNPQPECLFTIIEVVNCDMSFLVDSIVSFLDKQSVKIKNIIHPVLYVCRKNGDFINLNGQNSVAESVIQLHIEKISNENELQLIQQNIAKILENVALVVNDWQSMKDLANKALKQLNNAKNISSQNIEEYQDFINWLLADNFIFLGGAEFDISYQNNQPMLSDLANFKFGIFRSPYLDFKPEVVNSSPQEVGDSLQNPYVVEIIKSRYRCRIHRHTNAERVRIQKINSEGKIIGEFRLIGLFTSGVYFSSINNIPIIRKKSAWVIKESKYVKGSHNYKDLISTLEDYPRDELFQIDQEDLLKNSTGIVAIAGRSLVKFFARCDKFKRFMSCLIFMPRDHTNSEIRDSIKEYLCKIYQGEVADSFVQINNSNLIRFHVIIRTNHQNKIETDSVVIEKEITKLTKVWSDELLESIKSNFTDEKRIFLHSRYKKAFSVSYRNRFDARIATLDIEKIEESLQKKMPIFNLHKLADYLCEDVSELKIYSPSQEISLSEIMPILESFGFNVIQEHTYIANIEEESKNRSIQKVWIHYFNLNLSKNKTQFNEIIKLNFEKIIERIWHKTSAVSGLNKLAILCLFSYKQVYLLSAYTKYLVQIGLKNDIIDVLICYPELCKNLIALFEAKFDPSLKNQHRRSILQDIDHSIQSNLDLVQDAYCDLIIKKLHNLIKATLRTNYYQKDANGNFKNYLSFKFNSKAIDSLPLPLPFAEIFVYSTKTEAIHLRFGKVARGGLRWSDRLDDFRTEVLGLVKAQQTKNAVIVPVGSKGGFVVKTDVSLMTRDEIQQEGINCYQTFLFGLLDITDNVVNDKIVHPDNAVLYDEVDPYLVVAADKGTATFSDIANNISKQYNFWLGDAFASGGSAGYDHKKMGITAKGAWISVMRHFREMGFDTQTQDFTCVGIGDLAGDVFGNGMLLSPHIKLVAAFNHLHIFLDPNPDTNQSFLERKRMFELPRSAWQDYNQQLISKGGGIFLRSSKSIDISLEMQQVLGITQDQLAPNQLISAILKAPVDLLWNGGIGTYVKATSESHQDVGDKSNDSLRINGSDLRCKVVGEGGNLGFTQKGRIEYAQNGGKINTDAIDNSAGVDCSDHEVNIKIALISAMRSKKITLQERNLLLEQMTNQVADLVLQDNRLQTQAISIVHHQGYLLLPEQSKFLDRLEDHQTLNRQLEFLPSKSEIEKLQHNKQALTRPQLSVMLAYAKMEIYNALLQSDLTSDRYFEKDLFSYFPTILQQKLAYEINNHQLRKEIIATQITNFVINRVGITFVGRICQDSGFNISEVVKCLIIAYDSFRLNESWLKIEELDGKIALDLQMSMFLSANKLLERSIMWLLHNQIKGDISSAVLRFQTIADEISTDLPLVLAQASKESFQRKIDHYCLHQIEHNLATKIASMDPIASSYDIAEITSLSKHDIRTIATIYFAVGNRLSLKWLRNKVAELSLTNYWQKLASKTLLEDLYFYQRQITKIIAELSEENNDYNNVDYFITNWEKHYQFLITRFDKFIAEIKNESNPDLAMFIVALNRIKPLCN